MPKNRNLFRITRFMLLKFPLLFKRFSGKREPKKRVLIIKADAIGDYILFRNFIEVFKRSAQYNHYEIHLLGNRLWQDIALAHDTAFISRFFFVDPEELYYRPFVVFKMALRLFKQSYELVLQPSSSRTFITDGLAGFTAAKQVIGFVGDTERIAEKYKVKTDLFYTEKLHLPAGLAFEFDRTRYFFKTVVGQAIDLYGPVIPFNRSKKSGIIIFPGAGVAKRSWEAAKFLKLIKLILMETKGPVYLAGGIAETDIGNYLEQNLRPGSVINLINKTSLLQLTDLIGNAKLVIANETSAVHIAAATQTNAVCITGGGHFNRFAPYPAYITSQQVCVYREMDCYYCNWNCKFITGNNEPYPCIANISVQSVWQAVRQFIV